MDISKLDELLRRLCSCDGTPGDESAVQTVLREMLEPFCDVRSDALGNLIAAPKGTMDRETEIMLEAHADRIGMIVTQVLENGFLRAAPCGGTDPRTLPGSPVCILGKRPVSGVVCCTPPHLQQDGQNNKVPEKSFLIDVACTEKLEELVQPGDRILLRAPYTKLLNGRASCAAVDDRAGCVAVILCAEALREHDLPFGVKYVFCCREETGGQGASTAAFSLKPKSCISVDVSFAVQPGVTEEKAALLGGGPMVGIGVPVNRKMSGMLLALAKEHKIPVQREVYGRSSGTDADEISVSGEGVRCAVVSIPIRNMHTQTEVAELTDIENTAALMTAYVLRCAEGGAAE